MCYIICKIHLALFSDSTKKKQFARISFFLKLKIYFIKK